MSLNPYYVVKGPVITEESTLQQGGNKYAFRVDPKANKKQIREAIEEMFDVEVIQVNTMNYSGKRVFRFRGVTGKKPDWKKAVVTLAEGDTIDLL